MSYATRCVEGEFVEITTGNEVLWGVPNKNM